MKNITNLFKENNLPYCVWKDTYNVASFYEGNSELDIIVNPNEKFSFEKKIKEYGFFKLKFDRRLQIEGVEHYMTVIGDKYYHLHVYFQLRTGNHYVKEYFFPIKYDLINFAHKIKHIKVVDPESEFILLLIRLITKRSHFFLNIKKNEIDRVKFLEQKVDKDEIIKNRFLINFHNKDEIDSMFRVAVGVNSKRLALKNQLRKVMKYRSLNKVQFLFKLIKAKFLLSWFRLNKQSNKCLKHKGVAIAVMGTDGSGKTSVVQALSSVFKKKTNSKVIYLGGNQKTYSIETRFYFLIYYFFRVFTLFKNKYYIAWFLYTLSVYLLEYGKAKDRVRRIKKGIKYKKKGYIVFYERFPVIGLFDVPGDFFLKINDSWKYFKTTKLLNYLLNKIKELIENINSPDLKFLIVTDFEIITKRRVLTPSESKDILKKIEKQKSFLDSKNKNILVIKNNSSFSDILNKLTEVINIELCKYN